MSSSIAQAKALLYATFGHISGQIDQYMSESHDFDDYDLKMDSFIQELLDRDNLKYTMSNFVFGDVEFINVLLDYCKEKNEQMTLSQFDIDNVEQVTDIVMKQIEKSPLAYTDLGLNSRGVRQYAEAILSKEDE